MTADLPDWLTQDEPTDALPWETPSLLRREAGDVLSTMAPQLQADDPTHQEWLRSFPSAEELPDDGRTWFVASTDKEARDGNVWEQQWRLAEWRRNPVILAEHAPPVVGTGVARTVRGDDVSGLLCGVSWDRSELNPVGMLIADQHDRGIRRAVSVRMIPGQVINRARLPESDPRYQACEPYRAGMVMRFPVLVEVSSVAVPSDPRAIQLRSWVTEPEDPAAQLARLLEETSAASARSVILAAVRERPDLRRALLGTLPTGPKPATPRGDLPAFLEG